jgi:hypothetical protein
MKLEQAFPCEVCEPKHLVCEVVCDYLSISIDNPDDESFPTISIGRSQVKNLIEYLNKVHEHLS